MEERENKYQIEINGFLYMYTGVSVCVCVSVCVNTHTYICIYEPHKYVK